MRCAECRNTQRSTPRWFFNAGAASFAGKACSLPESEPITEDIDYDPETNLFYLTSILNKEIFSIDEDGRTKVFAKTPDHWPMMAVKIDAHRRILWCLIT